MATLEAGKQAPEFSLNTLDGKKFSLPDALELGPVILAFFKVSCPTCQYALPFVERLYKAYGNKNVTLVGVSQNDKKETAAFVKEYGITFPLLLDDTEKYPVSNAYGLTNVPTAFLISPEGEIDFASVSWSKADVEQLNRRLASLSNATTAQIFLPGESVAEYKPG